MILGSLNTFAQVKTPVSSETEVKIKKILLEEYITVLKKANDSRQYNYEERKSMIYGVRGIMNYFSSTETYMINDLDRSVGTELMALDYFNLLLSEHYQIERVEIKIKDFYCFHDSYNIDSIKVFVSKESQVFQKKAVKRISFKDDLEFIFVNQEGVLKIAGINYADSDDDGTPDKIDLCPKDKNKIAPGKCGCGTIDLDRDKDNVPDCIDKCPDEPGNVYQGCPDSDGDGVPNSEDDCPFEKGNKITNGCPDTDGDGIINKIDKCPELYGYKISSGCPDSDNDGVFDNLDKCPNDPKKSEPGLCGCNTQEIDRDEDGAPDCIDDCPENSKIIDSGGCDCNSNSKYFSKSSKSPIDTDGDLVPNCIDKCPRRPGTYLNNGCPSNIENLNSNDKGFNFIEFEMNINLLYLDLIDSPQKLDTLISTSAINTKVFLGFYHRNNSKMTSYGLEVAGLSTKFSLNTTSKHEILFTSIKPRLNYFERLNKNFSYSLGGGFGAYIPVKFIYSEPLTIPVFTDKKEKNLNMVLGGGFDIGLGYRSFMVKFGMNFFSTDLFNQNYERTINNKSLKPYENTSSRFRNFSIGIVFRDNKW
jgi:predicted nucleic acid-binding protein